MTALRHEQPSTRTLTIPGPKAIIRHAAPNLIEGRLIPLVLFLSFLKLVGTTGALVTALVWSLGCLAWRAAHGRRLPGIVIISAVGLTAKTVIALATGSITVYFLQPTISTTMMGVAFLWSLKTSAPLAERLVHDMCPFETETAEHPLVRTFFVRLSVLWSMSSLLNAVITIWLVVTQPLTTLVVVRSAMGPVLTTMTIAAALWTLRRRLAADGFGIAFGGAMMVSGMGSTGTARGSDEQGSGARGEATDRDESLESEVPILAAA